MESKASEAKVGELIDKLYYSPETGYISAQKLYDKILEHVEKNQPSQWQQKLTIKDVKDHLKTQPGVQIMKPVRKPKVYNSIRSSRIRNNYQIDLMIYDRFRYKGWKYILMVIDVYSRYLFSIPLKTREQSVIVKHLEDIFRKHGAPMNINCDNEFRNALFEELCGKHGVKIWYSQPDEINKNAIVERVNGTIAGMLAKWRVATDRTDWPDILPKIIKNYNTTIHGTTHEKPEDIWKSKISASGEVTKNRQTYNKVEKKIELGDNVRTMVPKKALEKGDREKYSRSIYTVRLIDGNKYYLTNKQHGNELKKYYKEYELQLVPENTQSATELPNIDEQRENVRVRARQSREFNPGSGHEVEEIDEKGNVTYKKRLQPNESKRRSRKPDRYMG